jgi:hypothetical protein
VSHTSLENVDLAEATLVEARLAEAALNHVNLAHADLTDADLSRARLVEVDIADTVLTGSSWSHAAILGTAAGQAADRAELALAAVAGRDVAEPMLAAASEALALAAVPGLDMIAVARAGTVALVDLPSRQVVRVLTGHTGAVLSLATIALPGERTLLAAGDEGGQVRLRLLTVGRSPRTAPALQFASGTPPRQRRGVFGARKARTARDTPADPVADPVAAEPPRTLPVPEVEATLVATLVGSRNGGWAALLADGRSYKADGDVSDVLWWVIKMCRFEAGELDRYDPTIRHLPHSQPIL